MTSCASARQAWGVHLPSPVALPRRTASSVRPAHSSSRSEADSRWPRRARAHSAASAVDESIALGREAAGLTDEVGQTRGHRRLLLHQFAHGLEQVGLEAAGGGARVHGLRLQAPRRALAKACVRILELICTRVALPLGSTNSVKDTRASPSIRSSPMRAAVRPQADRRDRVVGRDDAGVARDRAQRQVLAGEGPDQRRPGAIVVRLDLRAVGRRGQRRHVGSRPQAVSVSASAAAGQATSCGDRSHGSSR